MISIKEGKKKLKAMGYKLKATANPFKFELKSLTVITPDGKEIPLNSVITSETYDKHRLAIAIAADVEPNMSKDPN